MHGPQSRPSCWCRSGSSQLWGPSIHPQSSWCRGSPRCGQKSSCQLDRERWPNQPEGIITKELSKMLSKVYPSYPRPYPRCHSADKYYSSVRFSGLCPSPPELPLNRDRPLNAIFPIYVEDMDTKLNTYRVSNRIKRKANFSFKTFCQSTNLYAKANWKVF